MQPDSVEQIFEKNFLILLPYYIINYEKKLSKIASDAARSKQLLAEYDRIIHKLSGVTHDDDTGMFHNILQMMRRVMNNLLEKEPVLHERMGKIMSGKVLPLPSNKFREAKTEGIRDVKGTVIANMLKRSIPIEDICTIAECDFAFVKQIQSQISK